MSAPKRTYGVKLVRGPVVRVPRHPEAVDTVEELIERLGPRDSRSRPVAADLFCGAGGLSIGLTDAGYEVVLGVDHDSLALETHAGLHPGLTLDLDLGDPSVVDQLVDTLRELDVDLIAGGPPCQPFSRAGRSKIRSLVAAGVRESHDERRDLWQSYLDVVLRVAPPAVMMENVPDMAIGKDSTIVRTVVGALEAAGYSVHTRLLHAVEHGVPQFRQRFILVALADGSAFEWPAPEQDPVTVGDAIGDLPAVMGGDRPPGGADGFLLYEERDAVSEFALRARRSLSESAADRVYDHITRPVRDDDRQIFESMDSTTRYSDIDPALRRYRSDIFNDKYKRLGADEPSRSITAHIARDGYWYIHPDQHRTLTIREAARIQTFPDGVRFAGPPSAAFRQIGNAVPPLLGERVACMILQRGDAPTATRTAEISAALAQWLEMRENLRLPWLDAQTTWTAIQGQLLLDHAPVRQSMALWPTVEKLRTPTETRTAEDRLLDEADLVGRREKAERVMAACAWYEDHADALSSVEGMLGAPHVGERTAEMAALIAGTDDRPAVVVSAGTLRVATRVFGEDVEKQRSRSDGRLAVTRLIGADDSEARMAMAAVVELAASLCRPTNPSCDDCPLREMCRFRLVPVSPPG